MRKHLEMLWVSVWLVGSTLGVAGCGGGAGDGESTGPGEAGTLAALEHRIAAAVARAERVEAVRAVKRLQHAYGHYSELGLWHDFADLFSDDAIGHYPHGDLGREEIRRLFVEEVGQGMLGLAEGRIYPHIALSPVITLAPDGQTAKARWRIVAMLGGLGGNATWARGVYENAYVKERGVWKVQEITFSNQVSGRYGESLRPTVNDPADGPSVPFHYAPGDVGALLAGGASPEASTSSATPPSLDALASRLVGLETRVARITDESAVLNLQHAYGYYFDRKLWDDVADLFADEGTLEIGQGGVYAGKSSIRRALEQFGPALREGEIHDHVLMQPIVTVAADGRTAQLRGVYLGMTGRNGEGAEWREGLFENEFVKDGGVWKIRSVHVYPRLVTDYDEGWAKSAEPLPGPSDAFPPDRPPTEVYESYPKFHIPPFHFTHPVTGRAPQYPEGVAVPPGEQRVAVPTPPPMPRTPGEIDERLAALERQLDQASAYEAAESLINALGYYLDEHDFAAAAALFAPEGRAEVPGVGVYAGADRIRAALAALYGPRPRGVFELHQTAQPVIHPSEDGRSARVRARLAKIDAREDADDFYVAGVYEATVSRGDDGRFAIAALELDYTWAASHSRGWARVEEGEHAALFPSAASAEAIPPDVVASGPGAPPFPRIEPVPFHYANPVSGRPPERPAL